MRILVLLALLAAAVPAAAAPADCPSHGLKVERVTLVTASGPHRYRAEVAATPGQQECGLMFRKGMAADGAMIFPFAEARPASFWMENTLLPLDIVFVGRDGRVLNVAANAKPQSRDLLNSQGDTAAVVELNAGEAARIGLKAGDRVRR